MFQNIWNVLQPWLGLGVEPKDLTVGPLLLRAFLVFFATLAIVRMGNKRFLAKRTAFDYVLGIILAAVLARAVNGSAPFFGTLLQGLFLVLLHRILAALSCHFEEFGNWIKGRDEILVEEGRVNAHGMRCNRISRKDLEEDLRLGGSVDRLDEVKIARIERSGEISVLRKPHVIQIKVENGVQVVEVQIKG